MSSVTWNCNATLNTFTRMKNGEGTIYKMGDFLGSGSSGMVFELIPLDSSKKIKAIKISRGEPSNLFLENQNLNLISKPVVGVQLPTKAYFQIREYGVMIQPKYDETLGTTLEELTSEMALDVLNQTLQGLQSLKEKDLHPNYLKASHILIRRKEGKVRYDISETITRYHVSRTPLESLFYMFVATFFDWETLEEREVTEEEVTRKGLPKEIAPFLNDLRTSLDIPPLLDRLDQILKTSLLR